VQLSNGHFDLSCMALLDSKQFLKERTDYRGTLRPAHCQTNPLIPSGFGRKFDCLG